MYNWYKLWFIYTYLDTDKLCYASRVLRFAYNSTMAWVMAFHLSCIVEVTPCFCLQVSMRIWTPKGIIHIIVYTKVEVNIRSLWKIGCYCGITNASEVVVVTANCSLVSVYKVPGTAWKPLKLFKACPKNHQWSHNHYALSDSCFYFAKQQFHSSIEHQLQRDF